MFNNLKKKNALSKQILRIFTLFIVSLIVFIGISIIDFTDSSQNLPIEDQNQSLELSLSNNEIKDELIIDEELEKKALKLLAVGDIMYHGPQIKAAKKTDGSYDFNNNFRFVKEYISDADIAIANYETVSLDDGSLFSGYPRFNSPKESLESIKNAGFDIISTINNHTLDKGKKGLLSTLEIADEYGLDTIGTYKSPRNEYLIKEENDIKVGFLSYTYGLNGLGGLLTKEELSYMVNLIDEEKIKTDIENLRGRVDTLIVFVHWGNEYQTSPSDFQVNLANKMVEWGADIILGSHPHVIQRAEKITYENREAFVIYSMGNFISNQRKNTMGNSLCEDGVILEINIEKTFDNDTDKTKISSVNFIETWVYKYNEDGKNTYEIIPLRDALDGKLDRSFSKNIYERMEKSLEDTQRTIDYLNK